MVSIDCFGPMSESGLGNAYAMHATALNALVHCQILSYSEQPNEDVHNAYFHGSPQAFPAFIEQYRGRKIAYLVCESNDLDEHYKKVAKKVDEIWTASTHCAGVLKTLGLPVSVVPHCALRFKYSPRKNEKPVILVSFDGYSRVARKNPFGTLKAIRAAFGLDCKVIVKCKNLLPSYENWLKKLLEDIDHVFIGDSITVEAMDKLYSMADMFVSLHRAEGFGLQLLEAMAFGCKVVATGWGGNTDFMTSENSYLVSSRLRDVQDLYFRGQWAEPDLDSAVACLRKAKDDGFVVNRRAFETALKFSMNNTIQATLNAL